MLKTQLQEQQQIYDNLREFHTYKMQPARPSDGVMLQFPCLYCLRFSQIEEGKQAGSLRYLYCLVISCHIPVKFSLCIAV